MVSNYPPDGKAPAEEPLPASRRGAVAIVAPSR
jgi:hypothetical protein